VQRARRSLWLFYRGGGEQFADPLEPVVENLFHVAPNLERMDCSIAN
jgi:hypothetical protein